MAPQMTNSKLSDPDRVREAKRAIVLGRGYEIAAQILNISPRYVKKLAKLGKLPRSTRPGFAKKRNLDKNILIEAFVRGDSTEKIAKEFKRTASFIRSTRKKWAECRNSGNNELDTGGS